MRINLHATVYFGGCQRSNLPHKTKLLVTPVSVQACNFCALGIPSQERKTPRNPDVSYFKRTA